MRLGLIQLFAALVTGLLAACANSAVVDRPQLEPLLQSTVVVSKNGGRGSGVIIGPNLVLTAYHAMRGLGAADVRFLDGQTTSGQALWSDAARDIALVRVDVPKGYPIAPIHCDDPAAGDYIIAVGHPLQAEWVAVDGLLPATKAERNGQVSLGMTLGQGVSGGPVFDDQGRVIGITLTILTERVRARTGIGYMLPTSRFCQKLEQERLSAPD